MRALGQVSGLVTKVLVEMGSLSDGSHGKYSTKLKSLIGKEATASYESIILEFGWTGLELDEKLYRNFVK